MNILIVGQGLAGTILSYKLHQAGHDITIIDSSNKNKASIVAGGLINPVIFRRLTKTWMIDNLYNEFERTTFSLENYLKTKLYYPLEIKRLLGKQEDQFWKKQFIENDLAAYISEQPIHTSFNKYIPNKDGYGRVKIGGYYDLCTLIAKYREIFRQSGKLIDTEINIEKDISFTNNKVLWNNIVFDKIIFCEGYNVSNNPYFKTLRFKHTKGELLTIKSEDLNLKDIVSKNIFILPIKNHEYKVGATYNWNKLDNIPSKEALTELTEKLAHISNFSYKVIEQKSGIRPTTHDRRPVVGFHPNYPQIGIFNGLGSKGILLAPWCASEMLQLIENSDYPIHKEIHINRYFR